MNQKKIGVFAGSLRKKSYSQSVVNTVVKMAPDSLELIQVNIGTLPIFNQDFDDEGFPPQEWIVFRDTLKAFDGFLFVTPEYNRSVPPVLKNALDIGSRPPGCNLWDNKPGGIISVSPGRVGGFGANHHLRQTLTCLNVPTMQQPEAYLGGVDTFLDPSGVLTDERTINLIRMFMAAFQKWVDIVQ